MAFKDKAIPEEELSAILDTVRPYTGFTKWRLVTVKEKPNIIKVVEAWQNGLGRIGRHKDVEFVARWKKAPLLLAFYMPKEIGDFQWVPSQHVRTLGLVELGVALHGLMLVARAFGIETHWIAGTLVVSQEIDEVLHVPGEYALAFFVVAGYPSEEIIQKFPSLGEICYAETWGNHIRFGSK